jgi:ribosomal protein S24E
MAFKLDKTEEKPLLARKEVAGKMTFEGKATPSNADVAKAIASELKTDEKLVVVKHIYTAFGSCEAEIQAYVYNTEEDLKKIEPKEKKKGEKKEGEGEEAPAEAAPAEKPAEEKKEEAPKEEKKEEPKPAEEKKEEKPAEEKKAE